MKKTANLFIVAIATAFIFAGLLAAQENANFHPGEFGIRYMPTFSSLDLKTYNGDVVKGTVNMQHGFGVLLGANVSPHVGFQAEVNYNQVSQKYRDVNLDREVKISYINIPLLLSLNTNKGAPINLNFVAGPQFGINVGSKMTASGDENTTTLQAVVAVKKGDVGLAYGAGLEFALNQEHTCNLDLGYRGFFGLVDMNASSVGNDSYNVVVKASRKSQGAYVGLGFLF